MSNSRCDLNSSSCNITRRDGAVETYFNNVLQSDLSNCNCLPMSNGTRNYNQCQCCLASAKAAPPTPNCSAVPEGSAESCTCLPVRVANGSSILNCDCNYKNLLTIRSMNIPENFCGCLATNTIGRPCSCCVSASQYRDAVQAPMCDSNTQAICASTMVTVVDPKTKRSTTTIRGDCVANINGTIIANANMTLDPSTCSCYNDSNSRLQCKCCMRGSQQINRLENRICRAADQLPTNCNCDLNNSCSCQVINGQAALSVFTTR